MKAKYTSFEIILIVTILFLLSCHGLVRAPDVEIRAVNCDELPMLLDSVRKQDQMVRTDHSISFKETVHKDYENLSTVVSILESCGMPGLDQLSQTQFNAIWMVLHHSPEKKYMKKYLPLLKEAKERGDMRPGDFATVQDRLLMNQRKPQIYGTQIRRGKLYKLKDPEYVNQRREQVGLGPIEEYLRHFNIDFTVEQKVK